MTEMSWSFLFKKLSSINRPGCVNLFQTFHSWLKIEDRAEALEELEVFDSTGSDNCAVLMSCSNICCSIICVWHVLIHSFQINQLF